MLTYARRAAQAAEAMLAWEQAVTHRQTALAVLQNRELPDPVGLCTALLAIGETQRLAGMIADSQDNFRAAAQIAQGQGLTTELARAALGYGEFSSLGMVGAQQRVLLEAALAALGANDQQLQARVMGLLSELLILDPPDLGRAAVLSRKAVALARQTGDPATLAFVLNERHQVAGALNDFDERLAVSSEMLRVAEQSSEHELMIKARRWRIADLLSLGDAPAAAGEIAAGVRLAQESRQPLYVWRSLTWRWMQAHLVGDIAAAEQLAGDALALGQRGIPGVRFYYDVQVFLVRREQGRLAELESSIKQILARDPTHMGWQSWLAWLYAELDRRDDALAVFEVLAAHDFAFPNPLWLAVWATHACTYLGDAERAAILYARILPLAGRALVMDDATQCYGAADFYLGLLAATMERWADADRHFHTAATLLERIGARLALAHTWREHAAMLLRGGQRGDPNRAQQLQEQAAAMYTDLKLDHWAGTMHGAGRARGLSSSLTPAQTYPDGLSEREVEVLRLIAAGRSNAQIAEALVISINTVYRHVSHIFTKIGVSNRTEAATYAARQRLLP